MAISAIETEACRVYPRQGRTVGEMVRRIYNLTAMINDLEKERLALRRYVSDDVSSSTGTVVVTGEPPLLVTVDGPGLVEIRESKVIG